jgi:predicted membrane channel-forming protein YqfA (hemolysin III family)
MTEPTATTLVGVKYSIIIAGFFGSVIALTFAKELTLLRLIFAILTGCVTSIYTTDIAVHYLGIEPTLDNGVAFLIGLTAMALIPVIFSFIEQIKRKTDEIIKKLLG